MSERWRETYDSWKTDYPSITAEAERRLEVLDEQERREAAAERWIDEHVDGDDFVCGCGQRCRLEDGHVISPDPYASPVCTACACSALGEEV